MPDKVSEPFPGFYEAYQYQDSSTLLRDNYGTIFTLEEWEAFKAKVDKFYTIHTDQEIESHNQKVAEKYKRKFPSRNPNWKPCPSITIPDHIKQLQKTYKHPGWIYWIVSPIKQGVKIGKTSKWIKWRLRGIARQLDSEIKCIGAFHTPHFDSVELLIHEYFHYHRITKPRGEWFDLSREQIESIPDVIRLVHAEKGLL